MPEIIEPAGLTVTAAAEALHPTAAWTLQQLREAIPSDYTYRFILHDHDAIFSSGFDISAQRTGPSGPRNAATRLGFDLF